MYVVVSKINEIYYTWLMAIDQRFSTTIQLQIRRIKSFCGKIFIS